MSTRTTNQYVRKYRKERETYAERRARLGIKKVIVLCHESLAKEMQTLARQRTKEIIGEDVYALTEDVVTPEYAAIFGDAESDKR